MRLLHLHSCGDEAGTIRVRQYIIHNKYKYKYKYVLLPIHWCPRITCMYYTAHGAPPSLSRGSTILWHKPSDADRQQRQHYLLLLTPAEQAWGWG